MPSVKIQAATLAGLEAKKVVVEVDVVPGLRSFTIVGLPDTAVKEAKERIGSALKNSFFQPPSTKNLRVTVNLAPADMKKQGSFFDLPIALGYLLASGQVKFSSPGKVFLGELSLSGRLRSIRGAVALALLAKEQGEYEFYLPSANQAEAVLVRGLRVFGVETLKQLTDHLQGVRILQPASPQLYQAATVQRSSRLIDFSEIKGQRSAKRGLEIAAAGGHNLLMSGPPGSGKSLLAKALPGILPSLDETEQLEVSRIYSAAGLLTAQRPLIKERPLRAPHHTASAPAVLGGGTNPHPGEVSLAHRGVLFLDEFPEFRRDVLEGLRGPLEDGKVAVVRAAGSYNFPAQFMLIAAMNPCPCGYWGDEARVCQCTPGQLKKYQNKLSGPILDRVDLFVQVPRLLSRELIKQSAENRSVSQEIRQRIEQARSQQKIRFAQEKGIYTNAQMGLRQIKKYCFLNKATEGLLTRAIDKYQLSARAYHSLLKVARTVADLDGEHQIQSRHISEVLQYRTSLCRH